MVLTMVFAMVLLWEIYHSKTIVENQENTC